jgi:hypothetical protein
VALSGSRPGGGGGWTRTGRPSGTSSAPSPR